MERKNVINTNATNHTDSGLVTGQTTLDELISILGPVVKLGKTPKTKMLREEAGDPIAEDEYVKVYRNGYAVYNNGSSYTVVWVPSCVAFTYYFDKMKDAEIGGEIKQTCDLPEGLLKNLPWAIAVTLIGDHRIEKLSMQRKGDRKQNKSLIRSDTKEGDAMENKEGREDFLRKEYTWREDRFGESPESVYIRREMREEMLASMTDKQREAFVLYYQYGYTQLEVADRLGCTVSMVYKHLQNAIRRIQKNFFER